MRIISFILMFLFYSCLKYRIHKELKNYKSLPVKTSNLNVTLPDSTYFSVRHVSCYGGSIESDIFNFYKRNNNSYLRCVAKVYKDNALTIKLNTPQTKYLSDIITGKKRSSPLTFDEYKFEYYDSALIVRTSVGITDTLLSFFDSTYFNKHK